jgi:hypothetical protein
MTTIRAARLLLVRGMVHREGTVANLLAQQVLALRAKF